MKTSDPDEILLPDKLEEGEESPYRRRPKPVQVRRRRLSLFRILRKSGVTLLALAPFAYGAFRLGSYVRSSPRFEISSAADVVVEGNQYVSPQEVWNALGLPASGSHFGMNIFRLSLDEMRGRVESISWVKSATLTRALPHRLLVHVTERVPIAFVNADGEVKLVDADGVILEKPERANFAFPVVTGLDAANDANDRRARLAEYQAFMQQVSGETPTTGWLVSEVNLADADDLKAVLVEGDDTILVHFGHQDYAQRFHDFLSLIPEMRRNNPRINSVDLRYRNQVVVSPQPSPPNAVTSRPKSPRE